MLYQVIIATGLASFILNLILNLRTLKTPSSDSKISEPAPFVSVLIPARDEEANIEACLASLQKQDYPNFEVLVLDDNSSDNTGLLPKKESSFNVRLELKIKGGNHGQEIAFSRADHHQAARS